MGGGASRYDSIYKYKLSFPKIVIILSLLVYVHCPNIYQVIQSQWKEKYQKQLQNMQIRYRGKFGIRIEFWFRGLKVERV